MNELTTKNFNKALSNLKLINKHIKVAVNDISEINVCYKANLVKIDNNNKVSLLNTGREVLNCSSKKQSYIKIIENLIYYNQPDWIHEIHKGIENARINLPENFIIIFESLGLFDFKDRDVVIWWNHQKTFKRNYEDQQKSLQGLKAEFLAIDFEKERTSINPKHMSIHDDSLGYDLLSIKDKKNKQQIMIEVKSCSTKNTRFFLTENEYKQFKKFKNNYKIYLIDISDIKNIMLFIVEWKDINNHIPVNAGKGLWKNVEIKPDKNFLKKCKKYEIL